jgi:hypothetical protein
LSHHQDILSRSMDTVSCDMVKTHRSGSSRKFTPDSRQTPEAGAGF